MKWSLALLVVVVACGRAPQIELAACGGGVAVETGVVHSLSIDRDGALTVDGVACATESDGRAALERVVQSMPSNDEIADRLGLLHVPDAPLLVRIDRSTRLSDAASWLTTTQFSFRIFRTRLAVRDPSSGAERFLALELTPRADPGCSPTGFDPLTWWAPGVYLMLEASERPSWSKTIARVPAWEVRGTTEAADGALEFGSWLEVRDELSRHVAPTRCVAVSGALPASTPWSDVVPIVAEALERWHAEVSFSSAVAPTLRR